MRYIIFKTPSCFENRAKEMMKKFPYSPRKCTSVSSLSGCIHRYLSKAIISLPTQAEFVDVFEKTLIGGFTCLTHASHFIQTFYFRPTWTEAEEIEIDL